MWAVAGIDNQYYNSALSDVIINRCPKKHFLEHIREKPEVLYEMNKRILHGLNGIVVRMQYLITEDASSKVANILLMLASRFGTKVNGNTEVRIDLDLTQQEIANLAGLSRETVSLELAKLRAAGCISYYKNKYLINDIHDFSDFTEAFIKDSSMSASL